jgi:YebC/PmpR family DNA-binding regulatory protein
MSGHNKWSQIKHKKGATDAKKGKIFGKLARLISIAARTSPDPKSNPQLKTAIDKAREVNMPNENIERAIKKVSEKDSAQLQELQLEILGPAQSAFIVTAITDNKNRTIGEIKKILLEKNGQMADAGSLGWMFKKTITPNGIEFLPLYPLTLEAPDEVLVEALWDALDEHDDVQDIFTNIQ